MKQKDKQIICHSIEDIPSIVANLEKLERDITLCVLYRNQTKTDIETFENFEQIFRRSLPEHFLISFWSDSNALRVEKLITDKEISVN